VPKWESADLTTGHTRLCKQIATAGQIFVCLSKPHSFSHLNLEHPNKCPNSAAKSLPNVCR